jgi:hypothetical protein
LNSTDSDKDVPGGHIAEINNSKGEYLEVVEHLRREGCV